MESVLTQDVLDIALSVMEGLDCPRSLSVAVMLRYGEVDQLTQLRADPLHYLDSESFFHATAATDLFRKYVGFKLDLDLDAATLTKWWWAERECYRTNERLSPLLYGGTHGSIYGEAMADFVSVLRKEALSILGSGPPSTWEGRFGPGATVSDTSRASTIPDKMSSSPTFTSNALFHLVPWTGTKWATASAALGKVPVSVRGDTYFTVPKDARTLRACAKGPSINLFYQLGLGRVMKERLRKSGIDLKNGQTVHRQVACSASKSGEFVTIDLSSASDTVCTNLVKLVLPHAWHRALADLRSPFCKVGGKWVKLEKFSAMGNGYTFELESTLFASICLASMRGQGSLGKNLWVYGDDLIVPTRFARDVLAALKFFGFTPNVKKTFIEGAFRESCGGDFFDGIGVRAFNLEEDPNEPHKLISLANGIRRMAHQNGHNPDRWHRLRKSWFKCLDLLPSTIRSCRGPEGLGDIVVHDSEERWETRWRASGIRYIRVYRPVHRANVDWEGFAYVAQFAAALYGVRLSSLPKRRACDMPDPRGLVDRYAETSYKVGWTAYS